MIAGLVMAGGRSRRMRAGGCDVHKALRTVGEAPLIEWSLRALRDRGLGRVFVSLSRFEEELVAWATTHVQRLSADLGAEVSLILEETPLGTVGAVALLPTAVDPVLIVNVDNLTSLDLTALMDFHRQSAAVATIACHEHEVRLPFGRLDVLGDWVTRYTEKPLVTIPVSSGTYVLSRRAIEAVLPGAPMDVPRLIELLLGRGDNVGAYRHSAAWLDVNDERSLIEAAWLAASPIFRPERVAEAPNG